MTPRRILFLSLGLWLVDPPDKGEYATTSLEKLLEPDGARACRRNILALASVIVIAGFMGADPRDLNVFGVKPTGEWDVCVVGIATILAHMYWYVQRYFHLKDDGKIEQDAHSNPTPTGFLKINKNLSSMLVRRQHDLIANRMAFVMALLSWLVIGFWIIRDI